MKLAGQSLKTLTRQFYNGKFFIYFRTLIRNIFHIRRK